MNLTIYQARLFASPEQMAGGVHKIDADAAAAFAPERPPDQKVKKYLDPRKREQELYREHFGRELPIEYTGLGLSAKAKRGRGLRPTIINRDSYDQDDQDDQDN